MSQPLTATPEPRPLVSQSFILKSTIVIFLFGLLTVAVSVTGRWMGQRIAMGGHTVSTSLSTILINGETLHIPANAIRFENQRSGGTMERLDLYLLWPQMEGYTSGSRHAFNDTGNADKMLFVTIKPMSMAIDMSQRLEPVYHRLVEPVGKSLANGLTEYRFASDTRYVGELLYVGERPGQAPFVVRCLEETTFPKGSRNCMRDVNIGENLNIDYRFSTSLLDHWKTLDAAIVDYARNAIDRGG
ncbi:MAG: hypothetical protein NXI27_03135 [Alphaproteobacteria bacterium]|nr:hypothetical protein [Alphaproteobacteria bacterium]